MTGRISIRYSRKCFNRCR